MNETRGGLTPAQAEEFAREGVVRLPGAIPAPDVEAMAGVLWRRLEARFGAVRGRPDTWTVERPAQLSAKTSAFAPVGSPQVRAYLDDVFGPDGWQEPQRWGVPLVTFPTPGTPWDVPHRHWHLDMPATAEPPTVARLFAVLESARARGGGTGYVAGSHRVLRQLAGRAKRLLRSGDAKRLLTAREPWFAALMSHRDGEDRVRRFMMEGGVADGVPVRVCEMTGEPGDVILMDPMMLHGIMPNVAATPRMMLTEFVYAKAASAPPGGR